MRYNAMMFFKTEDAARKFAETVNVDEVHKWTNCQTGEVKWGVEYLDPEWL